MTDRQDFNAAYNEAWEKWAARDERGQPGIRGVVLGSIVGCALWFGLWYGVGFLWRLLK